jgi:hypothetical protein
MLDGAQAAGAAPHAACYITWHGVLFRVCLGSGHCVCPPGGVYGATVFTAPFVWAATLKATHSVSQAGVFYRVGWEGLGGSGGLGGWVGGWDWAGAVVGSWGAGKQGEGARGFVLGRSGRAHLASGLGSVFQLLPVLLTGGGARRASASTPPAGWCAGWQLLECISQLCVVLLQG